MGITSDEYHKLRVFLAYEPTSEMAVMLEATRAHFMALALKTMRNTGPFGKSQLLALSHLEDAFLRARQAIESLGDPILPEEEAEHCLEELLRRYGDRDEKKSDA